MPVHLDINQGELSYKRAIKAIAWLSFSFGMADIMDVAGNYVGNILLVREGSEDYLPASALMSSSQTLEISDCPCILYK